MRITGWHVLGEEAPGVLQQAVSLAGRRRHAQVTPLHIASAMLSASATAAVLRAACAAGSQQSHPLQHSALELRLNVALDRLPVSGPASAAAHGGVRVYPAPSNAFRAALKRARAHRRRGDKVELDQLVLTILDDPGVDRVMGATGFSSSQLVRARVQNAALSEQSDRAGEQPSLQSSDGSPVTVLGLLAHVPDHGRYPSYF